MTSLRGKIEIAVLLGVVALAAFGIDFAASGYTSISKFHILLLLVFSVPAVAVLFSISRKHAAEATIGRLGGVLILRVY